MQTLAQKSPAIRAHSKAAQRWRSLFALVVALTALTGMVFYRPPQVQAASSGPIIHWDHGMIYPGQNHGNPWGPVGETAVVHGAGLPANLALILVVVNGDSNSNPALCQPPKAGTSVQVDTTTTDSSGAFNASFAWPTGAGQVGHQRANSICSYKSTNGSYTLVSSHDDGPFTVLTDNKPTFSVSTASVAAGKSVTISGKNWVPAQTLNITIAGCADCDPGNSSVADGTINSVGLNTGTFSAQVPIRANATPGDYVVNVATQSGTLDAYHIAGLGVRHLTVTAPVAIPTPTAAPSPSPAATQTASTTPPENTAHNSNSNSASGGNSALIIGLIALIAILLIVGVLLFIVSARRKKQGDEADALSSSMSTTLPDPSGANQFNQSNSSNNPRTPFPQGQFGNATYPGYQQQSWQGNPQSNPGFNQPWQGNPPSGAGVNQPWQGGPQQGNFAPGRFGASPNRSCTHCGRPLAPNTFVCGVCGTNNAPASSPNDPTIAF